MHISKYNNIKIDSANNKIIKDIEIDMRLWVKRKTGDNKHNI